MGQLSKKYLKILVICFVLFCFSLGGFAYAFFNYTNTGSANQLIVGSIYLRMNEGTDTISLSRVFPESKEEARSKNDNYITFTVSGKNTSYKDINYEIKINNGADTEGKTRFNAEDLVFDLVEIDENDNETIILDAVSYDELNDKKIWVDKVEKNTNEEIEKTYKLRMWLSDDVLISDTDPHADYAATGDNAFKNHYASIKVKVEGDLNDKELPLSVEYDDTFVANGNTYFANVIENNDSENNEDVYELTITSSNSNVEFIYDPSDVIVTNLSNGDLDVKASFLVNDNEEIIVKKLENEVETTSTFNKQYTIGNNKKVSFDIKLLSKTGNTEQTDLSFTLKKNNTVVQELVKHVKVVGIKFNISINLSNTVPYTGSPITVNATVTNPDGTPYTGEIEYEYYSGSKCEGTKLLSAPSNTGTYCIKVIVPENGNTKETSIEKVITITKGDSSIQFVSTGGTYTGSPIAATVAPNNAVIKYYTNNSCTDNGTEVAPTNAGTYYAKATLSTTDNQLGAESECVIHKIESKTLQGGVTLENSSYTYDGNAKKPTVVVKDGTKTLVSGTDYDAVYSNNTNAGEATVTVTLKGNYSGTLTEHFTINKVSVTVPSGASDKTYTGVSQNHGIIIPAHTSIVSNGSNTAETNAGTYKIILALDDSANYEWNDHSVTNKEIAWKIVKSNTTTTMSELTVTYDGDYKEASGATSKLSSNNSAIANGNYTYTYYSNSTCTTVSTTPKDPGVYYVVGTLTATANYNSSSSACTKMTVSQRASTLEFATSGLTLTYGTNGEMSYTYNGDGTLSCSVSDNTVATCSVDTTNHKVNIVPLKATVSAVTVTLSATQGASFDATSKSFNLTVNKKAVTIEAKDQTIEYGNEITKTTSQVTVTGLLSGHTLDSITLTQSKNSVSNDGKITPSNAVIKNGNNTVTNNYNITYNDGDLTITQRTLTATIGTCTDRAYNGTTAVNCSINLSGKVGNEVVTATGSCNAASSSAGTGKKVTCTNVTLAGANSGNYKVNTESIEKNSAVDISKVSLTVTAENKTMTYGGSAPTYSYTASGFVNSETSSVLSGNASYTIKSGNTTINDVTTASAGTYDIIPGGLSATNYEISYAKGTLTIGRQSIAFPTCESKVYTGSEQTLFEAHTSGQYTNTVLKGTNVNSYTVDLTPTSNYQWNSGSNVTSARTLTCQITKSTTTTSLNSIAKTYNGTNQAASGATSKLANNTAITGGTYSYTYYNGTSCSGTALTSAPKNAGSYSVKATLNGTSNYATSTSSCVTYTMNKAPLTVTAADKSMTYGCTIPTYSYTASGFVNSETNSVLSGSASYTIKSGSTTITVGSTTTVGTYDIIPSGLSASNYEITYVKGTLSINKDNTTTTLGNQSFNYSGTAQTPTGASSKLSCSSTSISGGSYTYTYYSGTSCSGTALTSTPTAVGTYSVKATLTGTSNYNGSTSSCATYTINTTTLEGGSVAISGTNTWGETLTATYTDTDPVASYTCAWYSNSTNSTTGGIKLADATISNKKCTYTLSSNDIGKYVYVVVTATKSGFNTKEIKDITDTTVARQGIAFPTCESKVYTGSEQTLFEAHTSGQYTNTVLKGTNVNSYTTDLTPTSNYQWNSGSNVTSARTLTCQITQSSTTTSLNSITKTYNGTNQGASGATSKLANNTAITGGTYTYTYYSGTGCSGTALTSAPKNAGSYSVKATLTGTTNYAASTSSCVTYTIDKAPLTVTATDKSMTYGCTIPTYSYTASGFVNSETNSVLSGTASYTIKNGSTTVTVGNTTSVGTYDIIPSGLSASNYEITYVKGTLSVNKDNTVTTIGNQSFNYSGTVQTPTGTSSKLSCSSTSISGGTYTYTYYSGTSCSGTALTSTPTAVGNYSVKATLNGTSSYNGSTSSCVTYTISKAPLTVTAADKSMTYGCTVPTYSYTASGFVNSETNSVLSGTASYTIKSGSTTVTVGSTTPVGTYDIIPSGLSASNYEISYAKGTLTINKDNTTTTLGNQSFNYSGTAQTPTGVSSKLSCSNTSISGGTYTYTYYSGTSCSGTALSSTPTAVGTYSVKATLTGTSNYNGSTSSCATYTINTTTLEGGSVAISGTNTWGQTLTATYTDTDPVASYSCAWYSNSTNSTTGGTKLADATISNKKCTYTLSSNDIGKYIYVVITATKTGFNTKELKDITDATANTTATVARQGISFPICESKVYTGSEQTLFEAHTSGTYTNTILKGTNVNSYTVDLTPTSNYQWNSGSNVTSARTLTCQITQSSTTTTMSAVTKTYNGTNQGASGATSKLANNTAISGGSYTYTYYNGTSCSGTALTSAPKNAGSYSVKATLTGTTNYAASTSSCVTYTMNKAPLTVTAANKSMTYGGSAPTYSYTASGFVNSETSSVLGGSISYTIKSGNTTINDVTTASAGTYDIIPGGLSATNYEISYAKGTLTIGRQSIAFPTCESKVYTGSEQTLFEAHTSGQYTNTVLKGTNVNIYTGDLTPTSNYQWNSGSNVTSARTLTCQITQSSTTTSLNSITKTYNGTNQAASGATSKLANNTSISGGTYSYTYYNGTSCSGTALTSAPKNAGSYSVKATLTGTTNYATSTSSCVTYTMNKAPLTVTAADKSMTYGCTIPTYSYTASGFVNSETNSVLSGTASYTIKSGSTTITVGSTTTVGTYDIIPSGLSASNYEISYENGTLSINKDNTTTTLGNQSFNYSGTAQTPMGVSSKLSCSNTAISGGSYTYTYYSGTSCSGTALTSTPTAVGNYSVKATLTGTSNYNGSTSSCATYTINTTTLSGGSVAISGTNIWGQTLTATYTDTDPVASYSCAWYSNSTNSTTGGTKLADATISNKKCTYTLSSNDIGKYVYVVITATKSGFNTKEIKDITDTTVARQGIAFPTCESKVYTGSEQTLFEAHTSGQYTNTVLKGTNVNSYTVDLTPTSNYQWNSGSNVTSARTLTCQITQSSTTTTMSTITKTYNGTNQAASGATSKLANNTAITGGTYTYTYYNGTSCSGTALTSAPKNAGSYSVKATLTGTTNYAASTSSCVTYTMNNATPTVSLTAKTGMTFNGNAQSANTATVTLVNSETYSGTVTYTYYTNSSCTQGATTTIPTSGSWYVQATTAAFTNYNAGASSCVAHSIGVTTPTVSLTAKTGMVYNGSSYSANTATVSPNGGGTISYKYYTNSSCSTGETSTAPSAAGNYWVKASVTAVSGKTNAASSSCVEHTISNATPTVSLTAKTSTQLAWTGSAIIANTATVTLVNNETYNGTITYTYYTNSSCTQGATTTAPNAVGTYYVKATTSAITNYNAGASSCVNHSIVVATPTVSLTAKSEANRTYTGSAIVANTATVTPNSNPTITYKYYTNSSCTQGETTTVPKNVGTYYVKAYAAAVSNKTAAAESGCVNHSIVKSNTSTTLGNINKTYTGSAQAASGATAKLSSNNSTISGATFTYKYYTNSSCTSGETSTAPTNVGTYYVKATLTGTDNYNSSTSSCATYTMGQKQATITLGTTPSLTYGTDSNLSYTYDGDGTVSCSSSDTNSVTCSVDTTNHVVVLHPVKATTSTITITVSAGNGTNYSAAENKTASVTVARQSIAFPTCESKVYTGSEQTLFEAHTSGQYTNTVLKGTNVNSYTVDLTPTSNYQWNSGSNVTSARTLTCQITQSSTTTIMSAQTKTYNGTNQVASGATAKLSSNNSTISGATFTYTYYNGTSCSGTALTSAPKNAGSYSVKATLTGTDNYTASTSSCVTYTMNNAAPTVSLTAKTSTQLAWTGSAITANTATVTLVNNETYNGTITYTYYTNSSCTQGATTTAPNAVGTYYVKASITSFTNYNAATSSCVNHSIVVATPTVSLTAKSTAYTGSAIAANTATVSPNSSPTITYTYYSGTSCSGTALSGAPTNVGTYRVIAHAAAVTNKTAAADSACTAHTITQAATTTTLSAVTKTYNGTSQAASGASAKLNSNNSTISGASFTYTYYSGTGCSGTALTSAPKDAGNYSVKATLTGTTNYATSTSSCVTYTMNKKALTVKAANKSMTYGGSAPSYSYTTSGFVNSETTSVLSGTPVYTIKSGSTTISDISTASVGTYNIIPSGLSATNYEITFENGTLTIEKAMPVITLDSTSGSANVGGTKTFNTKANVAGTFSLQTSNSTYATAALANTGVVNANTNDTVTVTAKSSNGTSASSATITVYFTPSDTNNYNTISSTVNSDLAKTFTLTINPITRTAIFNPNGNGTSALSTPTGCTKNSSTGVITCTCTTSGTATSCSITTPKITAHTNTPSICGFVNSNTSTSTTGCTTHNASLTLSSNPTYYAQTYNAAVDGKVTFNPNGNTKFTYNSTDYTSATAIKICTIAATFNGTAQASTCSASITMPIITAASGFTTVGWTNSSTGTATATYTSGQTSVSLTSGSTWYAQSKKAAITRTLTYAPNGGDSTPSNGTCTIAQVYNGASQASSCNITLASAITKTGNTFAGWKSSANNTTYNAGASYSAGANATMTAQWTANTYKVNFYVQTTKIGDQECAYNSTCTLKSFSSDLSGTIPNSSYKWTFYGWANTTTKITIDYSDSAEFTYNTTGDINLYAVARRGPWSFASGNPKATTASGLYQYWNTYGTTVSSINVPAATAISGWTFIGYRANTTSSSTVTIGASTAGSAYSPGPTNLTSFAFNAIYERNLTISYDKNNGSGTAMDDSTAKQYFNVGGSPSAPSWTLSNNTYTRTGYTFDGWGESTSATSGPAGGASYTWTPGVTASATKTLYAIWKANELTFNNQTLSAGTYGTAYTSGAFTGASNGTGSYTYTISSGAPTGATIDSTNRKISFTASTAPGTYNVVVTATDNASNVTKNATMKIVIDARPITVTAGTSSRAWNNSALTNSNCTVTSGNLVSGHSVTCTMTSSSTITTAGSVNNTIDTYIIKNGSTDVTSYYNVTTATGTLTITLATPTISLSAKTADWTGSAIAANTATASPDAGGTKTYTYYTDSSCSTQTTTSTGASATGGAPSLAGQYYVKVTVAAVTNKTNVAYSACTSHKINVKTPTVSLTAKSTAYTGSAIAANTATVSPNSSPTITYTYYSGTSCSGTALSGAPTNVGTYRVIAHAAAVTNKTAAADSACTAHTITQAATTTTMSSQTKTYSGSAQAASGASAKLNSNNSTINGATFTYTYYNGNSCSGTALSGAPTTWRDGGYSVKATLTGTDNYASSTSSCVTYTMNKKAVTVTAGSTTRAWDGNALTNSSCTGNSLVSGHSVTCTMTSGSTITNAGSVANTISTYTIKSGSTDLTSNYDVTKATGTLTISVATPTVSLTAKSTAYTGSAIAANTATVSPNSNPTITYTYYSGTSCSGTALSGAPTNVGTYRVIAHAAAVTNKTAAADSACTAHTITQAATTTTMSAVTKTYNGSAQAASGASAKLNSNNSTISGATFTYTYYNGSGCSGTALSGAPTTWRDGGYSVKATLTGTDNYASSTSSCVTYTMNKKAVTVTAGSTTRAWDGNALTNSSCTGNSLVSGHSVTCTMTSGSTITNAGSVANTISTYTIKSGSTDLTSNYSVTTATGTLTVSVATPTVTLTAKSEANRTYTGSAIAANTATVSPNGGGAITYTYYTDSACSAGATTTAPTNVGTYYVKASVAAVTNKTNAASSGCVNHSIVKSNTTTTMSAQTKTYNGSAQAASGATAKLSSNNSTISGTITYTYYNGSSCSGTALSGAPTTWIDGGYSVKATLTGTSNYNTSTSSCVTYTMNKKAVTVTAGSTTRDWNGSALTNSSCSVTSGSLVSGHAVTCTMTSGSTITNAGSVANTISTYTIKSGSTDLTSNYNVTTATGTLKVNVATPTVSLTAKSEANRTYTGSAIAANTATVSPNGGGAITYTYYTNSACSTGATTTAPTNVGTYYVKASVAAVTNKTNAASSDCVNHSIVTKKATLTPAATTKTLTYPSTGTVTYTYDGDGTVSCNISTANQAYVTCSVNTSTKTVTLTPVKVTTSAVTVTLSATAGSNYSAPDSKTISVTVNNGTLAGSVKITGTNTWDNTLTASVTNTNSASLSYKWYYSSTSGATSGGTAVADTDCDTGTTCLIPRSLSGKYIYVVVTATKTNYSNATWTDSTDATENGTAAVNVQTPTCTLAASNSNYRSGSAIVGATPACTYGEETLDLAYTMTYYTNNSCSTKTATSTGASVAGGAPINVGQYYYKAVTTATDLFASASTGCMSLRINRRTITLSVATNGGTITGVEGTTVAYYAGKGETSLYTGVRSGSVVTAPAATKEGYTFKGWYSAASGGSQVLKPDGSFSGTAVSNIVTATAWNPNGNKTLHAQYDANELTFNNQTLASGTYGTAYTSGTFTGASNGTGSYTYTIKSGAPTGATIDSANRTISFTNTTDAGTYNVVVTATDDNSNVTKDATMTIVISKKAVTVTAGSTTRDWNGSALTNSSCTANSGGLVSGHAVTCTMTSGSTITNAGSVANTISTYTIKSGSTDLTSNYDVTTATGTLTVSVATPTVSLTAKSTAYTGSAIAANTATVSPNSSPTITYTYYSGTSCSGTALSGAPTNVGTYRVIAHAAAVTNKTAAADSACTAHTITQAATTTTMSAVTKTYNGSAQAASGASAKLNSNNSTISGATFTYTYYNGSGCSGTALSGAPTTWRDGGYSVKATLTGTDNYASSTSSCVTYTMNKKAVTVTAGSTTRDWNGSALTNSSCSVTSGSLVSGHAVTCTMTSGSTITNAGSVANTISTYTIKSGSTDLTSNYDVTTATGTLTVSVATPTVSLTAKSTAYTGSAIAANTATVSPNSSPTITYTYYSTTNCTGTALSGAPTNVGNYSVKAHADAVTNKTAAADSACTAHTITQAATTTTMSAVTKTYNGSAQAASGASAKLNSNNTTISGASFTYTYYNGNSCSGTALSGAPSTWRDGGYSVKATLTGTDNYASSTSSCVTYTMNKKAVTVTAGSSSRAWNGNALTNSSCTGNSLVSGHSVTCTMTSGSTITTAGTATNTISTYTIKSGSTDLTSNYSVTTATGTLTVSVATPTVNLTAKSAAYTGSAIAANTATVNPNSSPTITYTYYNGTSCSGTALSGAPTNVGNYSVKAHANAVANKTNAADSSCVTHTITQAATTTTMSAQTKTYSGSAQAASGASAKLNSNNASISGATFTYTYYNGNSCSGTALSGAPTTWRDGGYSVKATLTGTTNYATSTSSCVTYTMNKKAVTVTAGSSSRAWNGNALTNSSCTGNSLVSGHSVTCTMTSGSTITNAGTATNTISTYTIKSGSTDLTSNYSVTTATGTLTVSVATPTVSLTAKSATYTRSAIAANTATVSPNSSPTITYTYYSTTNCTGTALSGAPTNVGNYSVKAHANAVANKTNAADSSCVTHTITAKALTATLSSCGKTYDAGTSAPCTVTYSGVISGDTVTGSATCTYANATAGSSKTVTCTSFTKSGTGNANYTVPSSQTTTATISKATPTITLSASSGSMTKGGTKSFTATVKSGTGTTVAGNLNTTSGTTSVATVSPNGNTALSGVDNSSGKSTTVTVTGVAPGSATITVKFTPSDTTNFNSASDKTYAATVTAPAASSVICASGCTTSAGAKRYTGASPNNYVTFNSQTWRVVGLYGDYVKIIYKNTTASNKQVWKSASSAAWASSDIKTWLNGTYYNSLSSTAQGMIQSTTWYVGAIQDGNVNNQYLTMTPAKTYSQAQETTATSTKVGTLNLYEYAYSSNGSNCQADTQTMRSWQTCANSSWLKPTSSTWTINPFKSSSSAMAIWSSGNCADSATNGSLQVWPSVYLKSTVTVTGGSGTSSSPWTLGT